MSTRPATARAVCARGPARRRARRDLARPASVPRGETAGAVVVFDADVRVTTGARDLIAGTRDGDPVRVEPGEICGVVGANGCGKTTLVRALLGERDANGVGVGVAMGVTVGALEQTATSGSTLTAFEEATSRMTHVRDAEAAVERATRALAADEAGAAARLADARERYDAVGGATAEKRASSVLKGLGFSEAVMRARCDTLSGGWQMRVALARTLLSPAGDSREAGVKGGLLLLDEPSNHLDGDARAWLVNWIKSYAGTVVLVSHDEELLACVDRIVEVRGGKLGNFKGDYARFLKEREARRAQALSSLEKEGQKAAKLNEFITKFGAKATKASAAKSKAKALDKVQEKIEDLTELAGEGDLGEGPGDAKKVVLRLPNPPQGAREILIAKDLAVGYAAVGSTLVTDVNVTVTKGDRLLVIGPNGAGKSTFLKTIGGELPEMSGTVERGEGCVVGYFSQDLAQQLPAEVDALTHVLDVARKVDKSITMERARGVLGALGITGSAAVDRTIGSLSGGEKARVALAAFVLKPVNVLLLDEASNHLDGTAIEALCDGLRGWEGAVIAITHNPAFAAALNPTIVAKVENGAFSARMRVAGDELGVGDYAARAPPTERPPPPTAAAAADATDDERARKSRRAMEKEAANAPKTIDKIERALAVLDARIAALDADLVAAGADVARALDLQRQKDEKLAKQALYYDEWERLESIVARVAAFDAEL